MQVYEHTMMHAVAVLTLTYDIRVGSEARALKVDLVDSYLMAIKDIEESGQDVALAGMDNLTRARLRRKLKERWNTIDSPEMSEKNAAGSSMAISGGYTKVPTPTTSSSKYIRRRYSDNRAH
ncbi:hypothetical protein ACTXT7_015263 [Hymenolepis weldensis]